MISKSLKEISVVVPKESSSLMAARSEAVRAAAVGTYKENKAHFVLRKRHVRTY
jgi:hypothetical protein